MRVSSKQQEARVERAELRVVLGRALDKWEDKHRKHLTIPEIAGVFAEEAYRILDRHAPDRSEP